MIRLQPRPPKKLKPELGDDIYLIALNRSLDVGVAAISSIPWNSKIGSRVIIAGMNSQHSHIRQGIWNKKSSPSSDEVLITALKSPHLSEFYSIGWEVHEGSGSEVLYLGLSQTLLTKEKLFISQKIRPSHEDRVFKLALQFTGYVVGVARNASESLSSSQSIETFKIALSHSDYLVRSGAARRLNEKNEPSLYTLALKDSDRRIRWIAAGNLNEFSGEQNFRIALEKKQHLIVRRNAAGQSLSCNKPFHKRDGFK